jgi:hypothetical protein
MGQDRSLEQEGIPDLEGPLPEKEMTGDPQEGLSPPSDRPASLDYGATAEEQRRGEPLDVRLSRELPDVFDDPERLRRVDEAVEGSEGPQLVEPEDEEVGLTDDEGALVARAGDEGGGLSAEEAAMHVESDGP